MSSVQKVQNNGKLYYQGSLECSEEERYNLNCEVSSTSFISKLGKGGGEHVVKAQILPFKIGHKYAENYLPYIEKLFKIFYKEIPEIKFNDFSLEHRKYVFAEKDKPFIGESHNDWSEYTIIWYYQIDHSIKGGQLKLVNLEDDSKSQILELKQNDIIIFSGEHQLMELSGKGERNILTILVNGHF